MRKRTQKHTRTYMYTYILTHKTRTHTHNIQTHKKNIYHEKRVVSRKLNMFYEKERTARWNRPPASGQHIALRFEADLKLRLSLDPHPPSPMHPLHSLMYGYVRKTLAV